VAVLGVDIGPMDQMVASVLSYVGIPFVQINPSFLWSTQKTKYGASINLFPDRNVLSQALIDLVGDMKMGPVSILYEEEADILLWKNYLELQFKEKVLPPTLHHLPKDLHHNSNQSLVFFQKLKGAGHNDFVVYTYDDKKVGSILEWCQRMGLMSPSAKFLIASLGLSEELLKPYMFMGTEVVYSKLHSSKEEATMTQLRDNLIIDGLSLLISALRKDHVANFPKDLSCQTEMIWDQGFEIIRHLKKTDLLGRTGRIRIDENGLRSDITLDVKRIPPNQGEIQTIGSWSTSRGLAWSSRHSSGNNLPASDLGMPLSLSKKLQRHRLVITTVLSPPYTMESLDGFGYEGRR